MKKENHGRIMSQEEIKSAFIGPMYEVFCLYIDNSNIKGIYYENKSLQLQAEYLIAKSREDKNIEVTLENTRQDVSTIRPHFQYIEKIGLNYNGNNIEFKPSIFKKFPLINPEYGAKVYLAGSIYHPRAEIEIKDKRVEWLANEIKDCLEKNFLKQKSF